LRDDDFVKVLDFGLAQNIRERAAANRSTSLPVGTVRYMPPEQKAGRPATAASDIYSLALILEEAGFPKHSIVTRMRSTDPSPIIGG
jgi:eukaryotic-like serine/threonine-protein kinase